MKKMVSVVLIIALSSFNFASANDYYNYLRSDDAEIVQPQQSDNLALTNLQNKNLTENENLYQAKVEIIENNYKDEKYHNHHHDHNHKYHNEKCSYNSTANTCY